MTSSGKGKNIFTQPRLNHVFDMFQQDLFETVFMTVAEKCFAEPCVTRWINKINLTDGLESEWGL